MDDDNYDTARTKEEKEDKKILRKKNPMQRMHKINV